MRPILLLLAAIAAGACGGGSKPSRDTAPPKASGPTLVRFEYRDAKRQLVITARDRSGQVIGLTLQGPITLMADGRCGLGGRRNRQTSRFVVPARRLVPGRYRFTVRLTSSSCGGHNTVREAATDVTLSVARGGAATATDARGRRLS
jgi:hypothetical protein